MEREPIANDELVYRRVPEVFYDPNSNRPLAWEAFRPNKNDTDGLSVWLSKYVSPSDVAQRNARFGKRYYVLEIAVTDLRELGIEVISTPEHGELGHASLATMTYAAYQADKNLISELAKRITLEFKHIIYGPYGPLDE